MKKKFRTFSKARKFVHTLKLKNSSGWYDYCISGKKPEDIPTHPEHVYKGWKGYSDWINIRNWLTYGDAKKFVRKLKVTKKSEWEQIKKEGRRPKNIPGNLPEFYKKEWESWGDFLGTGVIAPQNRKFRSISEAKKFVKKLGIKTQEAWKEYSRSDKKPFDIPVDPPATYGKKGSWKSWGDFLGTGKIANQNRKFRSYTAAKQFVKKFHFTQAQWNKYSKSGKRPDDIPALPSRAYKKEWKGWGDFLGTGNIGPAQRSDEFLPWHEAKKVYRELAKKYDLKNYTDWVRFTKTHHKLLEDLKIPAKPQIYTKERVWGKMKK